MNCYRVPVQLGERHRTFVIAAYDKTDAKERAANLANSMIEGKAVVGEPEFIHKSLRTRHPSSRFRLRLAA